MDIISNIYTLLNSMIGKINDSTKYLGNEPINSVANDLPSKWMALGSGYARYKTLNMLNNQPSQYGILVNYHNGQSMVAQLWFTNAGGAIYIRGGSTSNDKWPNGWHKIYDSIYPQPASKTETGGLEGQILAVNTNGTISPDTRTIASLGTGATYSLNGTTLTITTL